MASSQDKFEPFAISTHVYKIVDDHPILLDVLIPKRVVEAGPASELWNVGRPIMVYYHPGWLVGGQRDFRPWWSQWIIDLMVSRGAIVVTADYRLIPEATCEDSLDDIHDAWAWACHELSQVVQKQYPGLQLDLSKILVAGSSAGGYCAFQVGLSQNARLTDGPKPRAVLSVYPYISIRTPFWTEDYPKNIFGTPQLPASIVDDHFSSMAAFRTKTGKQPILTNVPMLDSGGNFNERAFIAISAQQHGRILELFGPERDSSPGKRRIHPEDRIIDGLKLPPTVIIQGVDDTICPVEGSDLFVDLLRSYEAVEGLGQVEDEGEVLRYLKMGGEHLFETELGLDEKTHDWMRDVVEFLEKTWLA